MAQLPDHIDVEVTLNKRADFDCSTAILANCMTDDPDANHVRADEMLLSFIEVLGGLKTVAAYRLVKKWHA